MRFASPVDIPATRGSFYSCLPILGQFNTEGCAEGFIFCPQTAVLPAETASKGVHPVNFAYAHNEKPCSVTIDKRLRYEGVQIVDCIDYH